MLGETCAYSVHISSREKEGIFHSGQIEFKAILSQISLSIGLRTIMHEMNAERIFLSHHTIELGYHRIKLFICNSGEGETRHYFLKFLLGTSFERCKHFRPCRAIVHKREGLAARILNGTGEGASLIGVGKWRKGCSWRTPELSVSDLGAPVVSVPVISEWKNACHTIPQPDASVIRACIHKREKYTDVFSLWTERQGLESDHWRCYQVGRVPVLLQL